MVADRAPLVRHCSACSSFCWSVTAVTDLSARAMVTDPSVVCRSFAPRPSDRPSLLVCPLLRLLVCLLARRCSVYWPVACLSAGPSLVCLLARRLSVCWPVAARPSLSCLLVCLLVCHLPVVGHGRSCVCSFVARCSPVAPPACPSLACLLVRCFPVCCSFTSLSARAMVAGSSLVHLLPVAAPSTGVVTGPSLVCPLVRHSSI